MGSIMLELNNLTDFAKKYRKDACNSLIRNKHMNDIKEGEVVEQRVVDAVLTDLINYIGVQHGVDYCLYTSDLEKDRY